MIQAYGWFSIGHEKGTFGTIGTHGMFGWAPSVPLAANDPKEAQEPLARPAED